VADSKISALSAASAAALANELAINEAGTSKKLTVQQILDATGILAASGVAALADEALVAQSDVAKSMSVQKILDAEGLLAAAAAPSAAQTVAISQSSVAKALSLTQLVTYLQTLGMPRVIKLGSQHSISSATATKVTGLDMTLEAGTYVYKYSLLVQQATSTGDGPQFGINFSTGTATVKAHGLWFWDATSAITAQTFIMDNVGVKGFGYIDGVASNAYTTTAPDMGTTVGVTATGSNLLAMLEGIIVVTVTGNLELWRASEGANASTTEVGSSLVVIRTA
jgi:hypothetical protein